MEGFRRTGLGKRPTADQDGLKSRAWKKLKVDTGTFEMACKDDLAELRERINEIDVFTSRVPVNCESAQIIKDKSASETLKVAQHSCDLGNSNTLTTHTLSLNPPKHDIPTLETLPLKDPTIEQLTHTLLRLVDEPTSTRLATKFHPQPSPLTPATSPHPIYSYFLSSIAYLSTKKILPIDENETFADFELRIGKVMAGTPPKRKDQVLRLIFSQLIKSLGKKKFSSRISESGESVKLLEESYAPGCKEEFREAIESCRVTSKKKLQKLFHDFPLFTKSAIGALEAGVVVKSYLAQRYFKAERIVELFMKEYSEAPENLAKIIEGIEECQKYFPWPEADIVEASNFLHDIARSSANVKTTKLVPPQKHVPEKAQFILKVFQRPIDYVRNSNN